MTFKFYFSSEEEMKEIKTIVKAEAKKHFGDKCRCGFWKDYTKREPEIWFTACVPNDLYFEDLQKMKQSVYEQNKKGEEITLNDFISDVEENLSFVPKIEAETWH